MLFSTHTAPHKKMARPMKTYGRAREASPDVTTRAKAARSPLLSPNSRVKKLLADLGDSSDEDEDVEQLRNKFLSKRKEKAAEIASESPLQNKTRAITGKLPAKSIFDAPQQTPDSQADTQDDALVASEPIASAEVDSMADTQPDFETQPDEIDESALESVGPVIDESALECVGPVLDEEFALQSVGPVIDSDDELRDPVSDDAARNQTQPTDSEPLSFDMGSIEEHTVEAPTVEEPETLESLEPAAPVKAYAADPRHKRYNRVIADSDSEDETPVVKAGLSTALSDLSDISDFSDDSEDESQARVNALKERLASTVDELDPFEDADVSVVSSQKPTRKASKKALEEIERENQRINRQRNLAPEVYTTGLATKQNLLARFGMGPKEPEAPVEVPTTPTKLHSDDSIMDLDFLSSPSTDPMQPLEVKEVQEPATPAKMIPPSTPSLSRSVNKKQVKKLANVGVHRMASYITKRPSELLSTLSDSDDDLVIIPDAEADKVPESFRKMQMQGVPVKYSKPVASSPDFYSQMKANIRKQHAQMKADNERERQQLGMVDLTEQDKEDEAVESLLDQARRQQQEIADREKREAKRARDQEYDSVAESDHDWFDNDEAEGGQEVPDSDVDLSDEEGLLAQQALIEAMSDEEKEEEEADTQADTQPDFDEPKETNEVVKAVKAAESALPELSDVSDLSDLEVEPAVKPVDNTAYLQSLMADETAHRRREKAAPSGLLDGEAEESDDDWAGLGGASDEEGTRPEDLAEIGRMVDDTKSGVDKENYAANRQYDLQKDLDDDAKQVEQLLEDVTNGGLRRKRQQNLDLDFSDSEDEDEIRRKRRILSERKKKRMLEAGNLEDLAKNPEAAAFIRAMQDTDSEEDEDVFALPVKPSPALKRTTGPAVTKKKPSIQETLSFLCDESTADLPPSSPAGNSDMESDDDLIITGQTHSTIDLTLSRQDTVDDHEDDFIERLGPSRNVVVRETEDDQELKTIIGPNGNFHGLIRKKKSSMTSSTEPTKKKSSKSSKYLQQQDSETQKQANTKNRFLSKFKSVTKNKSPSFMKGGSFY